MSSAPEQNPQSESPERTHSSFEDEQLHAARLIVSGVPIQCQFCEGQAFRRSGLRSTDMREILMMKYPVRCLRCSQRQMVSFTIAGISVPSHVKQRKARRGHPDAKHWPEPVKQSLRPKSVRGAGAEDTGVERQEKRTS